MQQLPLDAANGQAADRPSGQWLIEAGSIVLAVGLLAESAVRLTTLIRGSSLEPTWPLTWPILTILACMVAGYLLADLLSGLVHWAFDRLGSETTPFVGPRFVRPFREHHAFPEAILSHGFLETNGNTCLAAIPVLLVVRLLRCDLDAPGQTAILGLVTFTTAFALGTNQFHKWAHARSARGSVAWLQASRLILSPAHHERHHTAPFDSHYCITTGWMNGVTSRLWIWLEVLLAGKRTPR